ncbi:MAG TPA: GspH/FimT family pseudopilin [bacterium]|nr:GspH/FimT family pseudopilin [bacterium]HPO07182.1 GspH/FimT family pseudopilin [bacterium]HQP98873.1 GspH/FimT family pseudopilin [bacterium]
MEHTRRSGFTLIELATVVVILAIVMAAGLPAFSGFQKRAALSAEAERLVQTLRYAQQRSILERQNMEVVLDLEERAYWIPVVKEETRRQRGRVRKSRRQEELMSLRQKIKDDYAIELFYYPLLDQEGKKGENSIRFYPDGTADAVNLTLLKTAEYREDEYRIFIKVMGTTGQVKTWQSHDEDDGWDFFDGKFDSMSEL